MTLAFEAAATEDAEAIAELRNRVAADLTRRYGTGHWSSVVSAKGVLRGIGTTSRVIVARNHLGIVATMRLATRKPWAIDPAWFTAVRKCLYLTDMAVDPALQGSGVGRAARGSAAHRPRLAGRRHPPRRVRRRRGRGRVLCQVRIPRGGPRGVPEGAPHLLRAAGVVSARRRPSC